MNKYDIEKYLRMVGEELHAQELTLEITLLGGAVKKQKEKRPDK